MCVYIYCIYAYINIRTYLCIPLHIYIHMYICVCVCVHINWCIYIHIFICMNRYSLCVWVFVFMRLSTDWFVGLVGSSCVSILILHLFKCRSIWLANELICTCLHSSQFYTHTCRYSSVYIYTFVYVYIYIYIYIHTYCTYIHIHDQHI